MSAKNIYFGTQCFASHCTSYMRYTMSDLAGDNFTKKGLRWGFKHGLGLLFI